MQFLERITASVSEQSPRWRFYNGTFQGHRTPESQADLFEFGIQAAGTYTGTFVLHRNLPYLGLDGLPCALGLHAANIGSW